MKPFFKAFVIYGGIAIAAWLTVSGIRNSPRNSTGGRVWFYDESEKKLYSMPDTTMPPDKGIGGAKGDGEQAVVVTFGNDWHDRSKWRIAYLQKYTPDLKKVLDGMILARAAHRIFDGSVPSRSSEYFQTNTLVKRIGDRDWFPASSDEGKKILTEWRTWHDANGNGPVVCPVE